MEIWKPIPGYEGLYSASNLGAIRSEDRIVKHYSGGPKKLKGAILAPHTGTWGYLALTLCKENIRTKHRVHRLVLMAFVGEMPKSFDACHKDSNRTNNTLENLRWDTRKGNMADAKKLGRTNRGEKNPCAKLTSDDVLRIRADTRKQGVIARELGVGQDVISRILARKVWTHIA